MSRQRSMLRKAVWWLLRSKTIEALPRSRSSSQRRRRPAPIPSSLLTSRTWLTPSAQTRSVRKKPTRPCSSPIGTTTPYWWPELLRSNGSRSQRLVPILNHTGINPSQSRSFSRRHHSRQFLEIDSMSHHDHNPEKFDEQGNTRPTGSNFITEALAEDGIDRRG